MLELHTGHGRSHDVAHDLAGIRVPTPVKFDQHRGARLACLSPERARFRHDEVHTRRPNAIESLDGSRDLALERTNARHLLHE